MGQLLSLLIYSLVTSKKTDGYVKSKETKKSYQRTLRASDQC